jgi:hypothetical protein
MLYGCEGWYFTHKVLMKWCGHVRTLWVKYQPSQPYNIYLFILELKRFIASLIYLILSSTSTCFIQKIYAPSSSLLQGKHLPFSPSPLRLNNFRLFETIGDAPAAKSGVPLPNVIPFKLCVRMVILRYNERLHL